MSRLCSLLRDERGASAAEFALVLPAALLILLGTIDTGRYAWNMNRLEKGVQMGARYAVATSIVPPGLNSATYVGVTCNGTALKAGDTICKEALGTVTCTKPSGTVSCTCSQTSLGAASCPSLGTPNSTDTGPFARIASRVRVFAPIASTAQIQVAYSGSGIGYAGDPKVDDSGAALSDVAPIVTVTAQNVTMKSFSLLGWGIKLPRASYSLTLEDGDGAVAY